ncbi:MAG: permease of phosphate ABC transporter [Lachnospiraceae bacterium]|nr:permease of phosphate ABC transporter [Lachnospiraceae bacterium]
MKCFIKTGKKYIEKMDIWDVSFLKICLCAMGVLIGVGVSDEKKKSVGIAAIFIFIATYIPLMAKYIGIALEEKDQDDSIDDDCFELLD